MLQYGHLCEEEKGSISITITGHCCVNSVKLSEGINLFFFHTDKSSSNGKNPVLKMELKKKIKELYSHIRYNTFYVDE